MQIEQSTWTSAQGWTSASPRTLGAAAHLALVFGAPALLREPQTIQQIRQAYPQAHLLGCSTAGEICGTRVLDDSLVITAVHFEVTQLQGSSIRLREVQDSFHAGQKLALALDHTGLVHVLVLADGTHINGSELVRGLASQLPPTVAITGGLAGDGARFEQTLVCFNGLPEPEQVAILGFYGTGLNIGYGSVGGWDPFGPERRITRSRGNVLFELDGDSALALYKTYLGPQAAELPASGLLFPLSLRVNDGDLGVVRTILGISEADQSITFAGDMPEGASVRLMKANFDRLIDGASRAAQASSATIGAAAPELAILISCVGRKLVLKQRIEEEVESVRDIFSEGTVLTGFYSYGEIAPFTRFGSCELHNQTMTITTFSERVENGAG
ncbi:MAG: FIST signal transduction protein [Roseiflexaceae bacterium]